MKTNIFLVHFLALLMLSLTSMAQGTGTLSGKITESDNGAPLPGAQVYVDGTTNGTIADGTVSTH